jgi:hypothetical protein
MSPRTLNTSVEPCAARDIERKERATHVREGTTRRFSMIFSRNDKKYQHGDSDGDSDGDILQVVKSGIIWLQNEKVSHHL